MYDLLTGPGKKIFRMLWLSIAATLCALTVNAQELLVHLPLDGTVQNVGSGGAAEVMGPGPATVQGHIGSAMKFDGHSVIAVPVDLSPEQYPRVTITAWVRADEAAPDTDHSVVSTGTQGTTPALRLSKRRYGVKASMRGGREALLASSYTPTGEWVFIAGTIDVPAQTLHVMQNDSTYDRSGVRTNSLYPASKHVNPNDPDADPQAWVYIGARTFDTALAPAVGIAIDDVRVYGGALTMAQLADVRDASGGQAVASAGVDLPGQPGGEFTPPDNQSQTEDILREREGGGKDDSRDSVVDVALPGDQTEVTIPDRESPTDEILQEQNGTAAEDGGIVRVDAPEGVGAGRGEPGPELSAPDDLPGQQLQGELDAARDAASRPPPSPGNFEVYRRNAEGPVKTIRIVLPGRAALETITYQEVDGVAVAQGDIILGTVEELDEWANAIEDEGVGSGGLQTRRQGLNLRKNTKYLWPGGVIPYEFHSNMTAATRATAANAAQTLTSMTNLSVIPRTNEANFVEFKLKDKDVDACSSRVGMKQTRGGQTIRVDPQCGEGTLIHELLHAAGFWHEQSRPDRDQYVEILLDNVIAGKRHNFKRKSSDDAAGVGPYNYRSVMHYDPFSFGKDCLIVGESPTNCRRNADGSASSRTILATRPGARFQRDLSTDVDAINEIYPVSVTSDGGRNWGDTHYATAAAIGDVDGDGRDEIAVGRKANDAGRYYLFDDESASDPFRRLAIGGSVWGSGHYTTALAFGDVDGDGRSEIGVTRKASSGQRYEIVSLTAAGLVQRHSGGSDWGSGNFGTAIAFGNIDNDPRDEILIGRAAGDNSRFYVIDDEASGFTLIETGGDLWGSNYHVVGVDLADVDADGRDEIFVARNAGEYGRYYVFDDRLAGFEPIPTVGNPLIGGIGATDIAAGDLDNDGKADLAVTFDDTTGGRRRYEILYLNPPSP